MNKTYLGDGAYVEFRPGNNDFILTAEDGFKATDTVYVDFSGMRTLIKYFKQIMGEV